MNNETFKQIKPELDKKPEDRKIHYGLKVLDQGRGHEKTGIEGYYDSAMIGEPSLKLAGKSSYIPISMIHEELFQRRNQDDEWEKYKPPVEKESDD